MRIQDLKPVSRIGRFGSWVIVVVALAAALGAILFGLIAEGDFRVFLALIPVVVALHVFGSIAITGYAPKYLRFAHGAKDANDT